MFSLHLSTLLLLSVLCTAQDVAGPQYVTCACSPTTRGYRVSVLQVLQDAIRDLTTETASYRTDKLPETEVTRLVYEKAVEHWQSCISSYSAEECVNADAALRIGVCKPNCSSFCYYNRGTWKNIAGAELTPLCSEIASKRSNDQELLAGPGSNNEVRPSAVNPNPTQPGKIPDNTPPPSVDSGSSGSSGANSSGIPIMDADFSGTVQEPPPTRREGCVAVQHIEGYNLQHWPHLRRTVLCGTGFCATPNHAIIVNGVWTSMKRLCEREWECVTSVKLVNNLKLARNRRAVVNDFITVTPYDLRFPKWAIWAVQMLEDLRDIVAISMALGGIAAVGVLVSAKVLA